MDLTSPPLSPWQMSEKQKADLRTSLARSADLLRMQGHYVKAAKLYREAANWTDSPMAKSHFKDVAEHCKTLNQKNKRK